LGDWTDTRGEGVKYQKLRFAVESNKLKSPWIFSKTNSPIKSSSTRSFPKQPIQYRQECVVLFSLNTWCQMLYEEFRADLQRRKADEVASGWKTVQ